MKKLLLFTMISIAATGCHLTPLERSAIGQHHLNKPILARFATDRSLHPNMTDEQFSRLGRVHARNVAAYERVINARLEETDNKMDGANIVEK